MKQTEHYDLNQWEKTDPIQMEDFNADNSKLEAELALLRENMFNLAYYIGQQCVQNHLEDTFASHHCPIMVCAFRPGDPVTTSGGVAIVNNQAALSDKSAVGSVTISRPSSSTLPFQGKSARLWLHSAGGAVTPFLNGMEMQKLGKFSDTTPFGGTIACSVFGLDTPLSEDVELKLEMRCGHDPEMEVYNVILAQL